MNRQPKIGLVGPCGAGKTTLKNGLTPLGYQVAHIAQEHSYVPDMWKRITDPDILIYLDVSYEQTLLRRNLGWSRKEYEEQIHRLSNARTHADLYIDTNYLTPKQVLKSVLDFLASQ
jgi:deoxyadenosine/deoxycytidine kinase